MEWHLAFFSFSQTSNRLELPPEGTFRCVTCLESCPPRHLSEWQPETTVDHQQANRTCFQNVASAVIITLAGQLTRYQSSRGFGTRCSLSRLAWTKRRFSNAPIVFADFSRKLVLEFDIPFGASLLARNRSAKRKCLNGIVLNSVVRDSL